MHSTLEDIPGIGATRRRALLTHFKSVANIANAAPEELCEVEGIGKAQAKVIWDYYQMRKMNIRDKKLLKFHLKYYMISYKRQTGEKIK